MPLTGPLSTALAEAAMPADPFLPFSNNSVRANMVKPPPGLRPIATCSIFGKKSRPLFTMNFHSALSAGDTVFVQSDFTSVRLGLGKPDSQGN
jgi:hypothetical protein